MVEGGPPAIGQQVVTPGVGGGGPHHMGRCLRYVCVEFSGVVWLSWAQLSVFAWHFLWVVEHISKCTICTMIELFPNWSLALEQIRVFEYYSGTADMIEDARCGKYLRPYTVAAW